jgi:hypothetical protein
MMKPEERDFVRDYMLKKFYNFAPIPKALGLAKSVDKYPLLNDELGLTSNLFLICLSNSNNSWVEV